MRCDKCSCQGRAVREVNLECGLNASLCKSCLNGLLAAMSEVPSLSVVPVYAEYNYLDGMKHTDYFPSREEWSIYYEMRATLDAQSRMFATAWIAASAPEPTAGAEQ